MKRSDSTARERENIFVAEYRKDRNGARAARLAGFSVKRAAATAIRLLSRPRVRQMIAEQDKEQIKRLEIDNDRLIAETYRIALFDHRLLYNEDGSLKPMSEWPEEAGAAVAGLETVRRNLTSGDGQTDRIIKLKLHDKIRAQELLYRHRGLFNDNLKLSGGLTFKWKDSEDE